MRRENFSDPVIISGHASLEEAIDCAKNLRISRVQEHWFEIRYINPVWKTKSWFSAQGYMGVVTMVIITEKWYDKAVEKLLDKAVDSEITR